MIPAPFEYELAESVDHALELLTRHGEDAKLIAGGHSLLPLMKLRLAQPGVLIDIGRLDDLSYVRADGDTVAIGALTRHETINFDRSLKDACPILAFTAGLVGDPQVRHRGTIGGSVVHGDPAADFPAVLLALDAEFVVRGSEGERPVAATDFFRSLFETDVGETEILTEIRVPASSGGWSYQKVHHRAMDWAVVGVAAVTNGDSTAVSLTTMGETPLRARGVEEALASGSSVEDAAQRADENTSPPSDPMGSADYRRALVKVATRRALQEAGAR